MRAWNTLSKRLQNPANKNPIYFRERMGKFELIIHILHSVIKENVLTERSPLKNDQMSTLYLEFTRGGAFRW